MGQSLSDHRSFWATLNLIFWIFFQSFLLPTKVFSSEIIQDERNRSHPSRSMRKPNWSQVLGNHF